MEVNYVPYAKRTLDFQYQAILRNILKEGILMKHPHQTNGRLTLITSKDMVFDISNGAPVITERAISFWRKPIAEIIAFMNGARTLAEMEKFGGKHWASWWKTWLSKAKCAMFGLSEGDFGPGGYGAGFVRRLPNGSYFNQFVAVAEQIKRSPALSTHVISPWIPEYALQDKEGKRQVVVAPCHGWLQFWVLENKLHMRMDQRSADVPIGVPSNMIQYAALLLMMAQVTDYEPGLFIHSLHDAQIYENQVPKVEELLERKPQPFPTLRITDPNIKDILSFRAEDFELTDYYPNPAMNDIPVTE